MPDASQDELYYQSIGIRKRLLYGKDLAKVMSVLRGFCPFHSVHFTAICTPLTNKRGEMVMSCQKIIIMSEQKNKEKVIHATEWTIPLLTLLGLK